MGPVESAFGLAAGASVAPDRLAFGAAGAALGAVVGAEALRVAGAGDGVFLVVFFMAFVCGPVGSVSGKLPVKQVRGQSASGSKSFRFEAEPFHNQHAAL